jgi:hypothetical protein
MFPSNDRNNKKDSYSSNISARFNDKVLAPMLPDPARAKDRVVYLATYVDVMSNAVISGIAQGRERSSGLAKMRLDRTESNPTT